MILTHRFIANNKHFDIEFDGPYDSMLWSLQKVELGPVHEAAVIGQGVDIRAAAESAVRSLLQTPFASYRTELEHEVQAWLRGLPNAEARQGDQFTKLYAVLKVVR